MAPSADNPGVVVLPPLLFSSALVAVFALHWLWPMPIFGHAVARWSGLTLIMLAVAIAVWGTRTMHAAGTNISPLQPTTSIVTTGPFRYSRNPLYVAITLLYVGLTFAFNTWWGIVALVPLLIIMHYGVVLREEHYLQQKFGETYRQYRSAVRRYLWVGDFTRNNVLQSTAAPSARRGKDKEVVEAFHLNRLNEWFNERVCVACQ
jgi:protein-S-isoprenylcysteine O-methyltransferase Ste14